MAETDWFDKFLVADIPAGAACPPGNRTFPASVSTTAPCAPAAGGVCAYRLHVSGVEGRVPSFLLEGEGFARTTMVRDCAVVGARGPQ